MKCKLFAFTLLVAAHASASECGDVTIADMNWSSASLLANIDRFILEHGYECDAELVPGDTTPTAISMIEKGQPDIAPEMWTNSVKEAIQQGVNEGRLSYAGHSLIDGGEEGFWVPKYLVEAYPELKTIAGVIKHAALFKHPENPAAAGFYGCPSGWACQVSTSNLFQALKLADAGFELIDPGSSAGLSGAIVKAYERKEGWFGYYWAPTAVLGKYEMVKVDFGVEFDEQEFLNCTTQEECQNPKVTSYPAAPVYTVTSGEFARKNKAAMTYLEKRGLTNEEMNQLLAWMENEQADGEDAMYYFFENYPGIWQAWLPKEQAEKVAAAL